VNEWVLLADRDDVEDVKARGSPKIDQRNRVRWRPAEDHQGGRQRRRIACQPGCSGICLELPRTGEQGGDSATHQANDQEEKSDWQQEKPKNPGIDACTR
jgi:hypothetical protein